MGEQRVGSTDSTLNRKNPFNDCWCTHPPCQRCMFDPLLPTQWTFDRHHLSQECFKHKSRAAGQKCLSKLPLYEPAPPSWKSRRPTKGTVNSFRSSSAPLWSSLRSASNSLAVSSLSSPVRDFR